jgi:outer membrane protein insertion porin family
MAVSPNNRFYTGGDDSVRGFDIRSISPVAFVPVASSTQMYYAEPNQLDSSGGASYRALSIPILSYTIVYPGGDTQLIGNAEYRIPLVGPVSMSLFFDAGLNGILRKSQLRLDSDGFSQLQSQFPNTKISNSLQFLPGSNFAPRTSTGVEFIIQLPIVQAPFRIYWAFNPTRYSQSVTAPSTAYYLSDTFRNSLPPGVYEQMISPSLNYLLRNTQEVKVQEKRSTFRFTVSRTF